MKKIIAVLDIGKTNIKLCAMDSLTGNTIVIVKHSNTVLNSPPYPHVNIDGIWTWYCAQLKILAEQFCISHLCCTTHGATVVCLAGETVVFPVYDYESDLCEKTDRDYENLRPPYSETLSPALNVGLNAGRQLYWLSQTEPQKFKQVDTILMYPQFWAWRLCGVAASEVTSLGCHTDLWQPLENRYSSLVGRMGWTQLFPPLRAAGESLGPVSQSLAKELAIPQDCQVINGIHDSNASLVPYLRNESQPFTVISSGTWVVIANLGASIDDLSEDDDMLSNVSAHGDPVPCIRFMGGREWELLRGDEEGDEQDLEEVLRSGVYLTPSFTSQGGPFSDVKGAVIGPINNLNGGERAVLASLYCSLVTDFCLNRIKSTGKIIVEGSFASNRVFLTVLQSLRPQQEIRISTDTTGTTLGAAQLIEGCNWSKKELSTIDGNQTVNATNVFAYREHWKSFLSE